MKVEPDIEEGKTTFGFGELEKINDDNDDNDNITEPNKKSEMDTIAKELGAIYTLLADPKHYKRYREISGHPYAYLWLEIITGSIFLRLPWWLIFPWILSRVFNFIYWMIIMVLNILSCFQKYWGIHIKNEIIYYGIDRKKIGTVISKEKANIVDGIEVPHLPRKCHCWVVHSKIINLGKIRDEILNKEHIGDIQKIYILKFFEAYDIYDNAINMGANYYLNVRIVRVRRYTRITHRDGKTKRRQVHKELEKVEGKWAFKEEIDHNCHNIRVIKQYLRACNAKQSSISQGALLALDMQSVS